MTVGAWQSYPQPHLPKSKKYYRILHRIGFEYKGFRFLGEYLIDKETSELVWFIYPYENEFFKNTLVFSDRVMQSPMYQRNIYDITINNPNLKMLLNSFRESNIFFSDDLTGTDFKSVIDFQIRK